MTALWDGILTTRRDREASRRRLRSLITRRHARPPGRNRRRLTAQSRLRSRRAAEGDADRGLLDRVGSAVDRRSSHLPTGLARSLTPTSNTAAPTLVRTAAGGVHRSRSPDA